VGICIAGFCETVIARVFGLFKTVVLARFAILVKIDFLFFIHLQKTPYKIHIISLIVAATIIALAHKDIRIAIACPIL
jgi:hypothetical protein